MSQYRSVAKIFATYWSQYGGISALLKSPYLHVSVLVAIISYPSLVNGEWAKNALEIIPNLLGFSLGGYAMLLAFSNEKFLMVLVKPTGSALSSMSSSFVHFIVVQIVVLVISFAYLSSPIEELPRDLKVFVAVNVPGSVSIYHFLNIVSAIFGAVLFVYSLMTALAATMSIFRVYIWYEKYLLREKLKAEAQKKAGQGCVGDPGESDQGTG